MCNPVELSVLSRGRYIRIVKTCGDYFMGEKVLCEACNAQAIKDYPQGWASYPGDTCKHGVYVGGCGADYICGRCEAGDDE